MAALIELAAEVTLVALFLLCLLMLQGYRFSLHPVIQGLAWILQQFAVAVPFIGKVGPGPWLAKQVRALDHAIISGLSQGVKYSEEAIVGLWNGMAAIAEWYAREIEALARDTYKTFTAIGALPFRKLIRYVEHSIAVSVALAYHRLLKIIGTATHGLGARIIGVLHRVVALEHELGHWVGYTGKQLRALLRKLGQLGWIAGIASIGALGLAVLRKLGLKWLYGYKGVGALVAAGLAKIGLGFLRCDNFRNAVGGRKGGPGGLCGIDGSLLDTLLLDATLIAGTISIVEFARELQGLEGEAVGLIRGFIRDK